MTKQTWAETNSSIGKRSMNADREARTVRCRKPTTLPSTVAIRAAQMSIACHAAIRPDAPGVAKIRFTATIATAGRFVRNATTTTFVNPDPSDRGA